MTEPTTGVWDEATRRHVRGLFEEVFAGLPAKIDRCAELGWDWEAVSTPFVEFEGELAVAHVGVLEIPMVLDGTETTVAGIHAACTLSAHRRRGHMRRALARAVAYAHERCASSQLTTAVPDVFTGHGYRSIELRCYSVRRPARSACSFRPLSIDVADDVALLQRLLAARTPVSQRCAAVDPGWLFGIDEVLEGKGFARLLYCAELDVVVAREIRDGQLQLLDVVASELPALDDILVRLDGGGESAVLYFTPDRFGVEIESTEIAWPGEFLMVRGPYPDGELGLSPLAHC